MVILQLLQLTVIYSKLLIILKWKDANTEGSIEFNAVSFCT